MKIRSSQFVTLLVWMATIILIGAVWSQEPESSQSRTPEQLLDHDMDKAASRLYRNALRFYQDQAYWKAARELILLIDYYPAFSQTDGVLYHLGESLYEMGMYKSAAQMFRFLLTKHQKSEYIGQALYGLQRIHYQTENYEESLQIFSGIAARFADGEIIDGARYHAGMAYYNQRDYDNCIASLSGVRSRSEYFDYSLYTVGLSYLKKKWSPRPLPHFASC
jgi:TolA-binding protein